MLGVEDVLCGDGRCLMLSVDDGLCRMVSVEC